MLPPAVYIEHDADFRQLIDRLATETLIAVDTESNSMYAYQERVCLIQISTRTADFIIDPLRVADLSALGPILANPAVEKVFHAAEYDLICMKRDYGFAVNNLFDTMWAARICGHKMLGLNRLLAEYLGIEADKSHQRDDWGKRPLSAEGLLYAQMDTHYLPALRDKLLAKLEEMGHLDEAYETFADYVHVSVSEKIFDPEGFWRLTHQRELTRRQWAILRELYLLRNSIAQHRDVPAYKVFADATLVALAKAAPTKASDLKRVNGLTSSNAQRYGHELLHTLDRGRRAPLPQFPQRLPETDPVVVERFMALRDWRRSRAEHRDVESDVILSKDAMWALAFKDPHTLDDLQQIEGLGPWRVQTYGQEILDVLERVRT